MAGSARAGGAWLGPEDHRIVTEAVTAAERSTDAEIVTVIADRSDDYRDLGLALAAAVSLLPLVLASLLPDAWTRWTAWATGAWDGAAPLPQALLLLMVAQVLSFALTALTLSHDALRFRLVPAPYRRRRVRERAVATFRIGAEARTEARHGLLIYVSMRERMAELIVDEGLMGRTDERLWVTAMSDLIRLMREGSPGAAIAAAIGDVGAQLATIAPKTAGDADELPDRLIVL